MADEVLMRTVGEMTTVAADGKQRVQTMLPIEFLSGWLFTIKKVRPEVQDKLNVFRAEGFVALDAWFRKKGLAQDKWKYYQQNCDHPPGLHVFASPLRHLEWCGVWSPFS